MSIGAEPGRNVEHRAIWWDGGCVCSPCAAPGAKFANMHDHGREDVKECVTLESALRRYVLKLER